MCAIGSFNRGTRYYSAAFAYTVHVTHPWRGMARTVVTGIQGEADFRLGDFDLGRTRVWSFLESDIRCGAPLGKYFIVS